MQAETHLVGKKLRGQIKVSAILISILSGEILNVDYELISLSAIGFVSKTISCYIYTV